MGEKDQVRWVGTLKIDPAISDIQAIEAAVQFVDIHTQVGAGNHSIATGVVPGGKIWVVTYCIAGNSDVSSNIFYSIFQLAVEKVRINQNATAVAWEMVKAAGNLIVDEGQHILFQHNGIANGVLCLSSLCGYQIDKY